MKIIGTGPELRRRAPSLCVGAACLPQARLGVQAGFIPRISARREMAYWHDKLCLFLKNLSVENGGSSPLRDELLP